jgi:glycosyltransferase involved in cell wall biosynthesis
MQISVVIPAYGQCPHLPGNLRALLAGERAPDEVIVAHSGPCDPTDKLAALGPAVRVLHSEDRLLGGAARNRGAAAARGALLAFLDADVRPAPDWLARLAAAHRPGRFVVGSVGMAETGGYWGVCNWISEFSEQTPWRKAGAQTGGASCNMLVAAPDFAATEGFPEDHQPGEDTLLFTRLRADGLTQWFAPEARVDHYNQRGFAAFRRHQARLGYHSALVRERAALDGSLAARVRPLALLLWPARLWRISVRLAAGGPRWWARAAVQAPGLVLGSWIWTGGFLRRVYGARG